MKSYDVESYDYHIGSALHDGDACLS